MSRILAHVDLNAFFASAERLRHPEWKGEAIVVGGEGPRAVVSTASYEARKLGVHSGMPMFEARRRAPRAHYCPVDFRFYEMLSRSFFTHLERYAPLVEEVSIDEGYLDLTDRIPRKDPLPYLRRIQGDILHEIGLPCSIGVAPTRFLAKMASDLRKPLGITILRKRDIPAVLYPLPIGDFWGIGKKGAERLRAIGVMTIGDFARAIKEEEPLLRERLGKFVDTAREWLEGKGDDRVDPRPFDPKSIGHSETFPYDTSDWLRIRDHLLSLARSVSEGAKARKRKGRTVVLLVRDSEFHNHSRSITMKESTDSFEEIFSRAEELFERNFLGMDLRLVGITLQGLVDPRKEDVQLTFWNYEEYKRLDQTRTLVKEWNRKLPGANLLLLGSLRKERDGRP